MIRIPNTWFWTEWNDLYPVTTEPAQATKGSRHGRCSRGGAVLVVLATCGSAVCGPLALFDEDGVQLDEFWTLRSTGIAVVSTHASDVIGHEYILWTADSKEFVLGNDLSRWSVLVGPIANVYNRWSDSTFTYGQGAHRFKVGRMTPNEIVLDYPSDRMKISLRREE